MLSKDKQERALFLFIAFGIIFGIYFMGSFTRKTDFGDAALGEGTLTYFASDSSGNSVHYLPRYDVVEFLNGLETYKNFQKVLFLSNSQSHSINQMEIGDNSMSGYLFNDFINDSLAFISASVPNANLQEHYLLSEFFVSKLSKIELMILPVFFDDFREDGIREAYFKDFAPTGFQVNGNDEISNSINLSLNNFSKKNISDTLLEQRNEGVKGTEDFYALKETTQDVTERKLNSSLYNNLDFWKNREQLRGEYFTMLHLSRNTMFNISAQSTRRMIPARYEKNMLALRNIISSCAKNSIELLLVIPPLRTDIKYPYDKVEYREFKEYLMNLERENVSCVNLEKVVDGKYWGYSAPSQLFQTKDYDFMHFQAEGHKLLADSLKPHIVTILK